MRPPAWHARALCRGQTAAFDDEHAETVRAAKAVCSGCPVAGECLEVGLFEPWGVWGGLTTEERRALVKNLRRAS
jgi:WhiB family transcriptional regulator, redox-sensing transcriptional regulator